MSTNINLLKALSQILFSATHKQFPVTSLGVSHAGWPCRCPAPLVPSSCKCQAGIHLGAGIAAWPLQAPEEAPQGNAVPSLLCFLSSSLSSLGCWWLLCAWQGHWGAEDMSGVLLGWGGLWWAGRHTEASPDVSTWGVWTHCLFSDPVQPTPSPLHPCPPRPAPNTAESFTQPTLMLPATHISFMLSVLGGIWPKTAETTFIACKIVHTQTHTCVCVHTCVHVFLTTSAVGNR